MTSAEIKSCMLKADTGLTLAVLEIAYQLAVQNEREVTPAKLQLVYRVATQALADPAIYKFGVSISTNALLKICAVIDNVEHFAPSEPAAQEPAPEVTEKCSYCGSEAHPGTFCKGGNTI